MKKTYTLTYDHVTGVRAYKTTQDPTELLSLLELAIMDAYVADGSIIVNTEIKEEKS